MTTLSELDATAWRGQAELWLDSLGNEVQTSDCTISIEASAVRYTWAFKGEPQTGTLELNADGAAFSDSWHGPTPMPCTAVPSSWALLDVLGTYGAGEGPDWGWRTTLSQRPSGELVLQMTNIAPWGEETRAVRMVCTSNS